MGRIWSLITLGLTMLKRLRRRVRVKRRPWADEYFERFVLPHVERIRAAGVDTDEIEQLYRIAVNQADLTLTFPGGIMRDFADHVEAGGSTADIVGYFNSPEFVGELT